MQLNDGQAAESRGESARSEQSTPPRPSPATQGRESQLWFDGELHDAGKVQATLGTHALP